jgi:hypothetical protein
VVRVQLRSNLKTSLPLGISCDIAAIKPADGIVYAGLLLTGLYVLITVDVSYLCQSISNSLFHSDFGCCGLNNF